MSSTAAPLIVTPYLHYACYALNAENPMNRKRGRPAGPREGAKEAVAEIAAARRLISISENELAARGGLNQSTVNRLLNSAEPAWTPALHTLWNYAVNILQAKTAESVESSQGNKSSSPGRSNCSMAPRAAPRACLDCCGRSTKFEALWHQAGGVAAVNKETPILDVRRGSSSVSS